MSVPPDDALVIIWDWDWGRVWGLWAGCLGEFKAMPRDLPKHMLLGIAM